MNKDRVEGKVKDVAGRVERQAGEWTGDPKKQVEGAAKQEAGAPPPGTGAGLTWASAQLPPPTSFVANPTAPCGTQIVGQWPITLGVLPSLTLSA